MAKSPFTHQRIPGLSSPKVRNSNLDRVQAKAGSSSKSLTACTCRTRTYTRLNWTRDAAKQFERRCPERTSWLLARCFRRSFRHRSFFARLLQPSVRRPDVRSWAETQFVKESYNLLGDDGVIVVVAPLRTFNTYEFRVLLDTHFKDMQLYRFPEPQFGEVVMIGRKRSTILEDSGKNESSLLSRYKLASHSREFDYKLSRYRGVNDVMDLPALGTVACDWEKGCPGQAHAMIRVWDVPVSWKPSRFAKGDYLPEELIEAIDQSPNNASFREAKDPPIQESPLPLERGHVALLVTSGALDGLIEVPGVGSHVMRSISRKVEYANDELSKAVLSKTATRCE